MPLADLFAEAERQLTICNSCRYCTGYCPVWPALERRVQLTAGDITHLANLCHDCQECFTACMYIAPHEFDLNPPKVFAEVREDSYRRYVPGWPVGWRGVVGATLAVGALLVVLAYLTTGRVLTNPGNGGSPYAIIPHLLMVGLVAVPSLWTVGVLALAVVRCWRDIHGPLRDLGRLALWPKTLFQGAQLRHMTGAGQECEPNPGRRPLHLAVSYGFGLCVVSTVSAAVMQQFLGLLPPYAYLSVPVVTGTAGGIGMVAGCAGLLVLKRRGDPGRATPSMRRADQGFLWALLVLGASGLGTLFLRATPAFGPILVAHLASVVVAFAIAPYTKFVHWLYRLLAIYQHNLESGG